MQEFQLRVFIYPMKTIQREHDNPAKFTYYSHYYNALECFFL